MPVQVDPVTITVQSTTNVQGNKLFFPRVNIDGSKLLDGAPSVQFEVRMYNDEVTPPVFANKTDQVSTSNIYAAAINMAGRGRPEVAILLQENGPFFAALKAWYLDRLEIKTRLDTQAAAVGTIDEELAPKKLARDSADIAYRFAAQALDLAKTAALVASQKAALRFASNADKADAAVKAQAMLAAQTVADAAQQSLNLAQATLDEVQSRRDLAESQRAQIQLAWEDPANPIPTIP